MFDTIKARIDRLVDRVRRRRDPYAGNWSTPHPDLMSGLVPLTFSIRLHDGDLPPARLIVEIAGHRHVAKVVSRGDRAQAQLAMHSHLLPEGHHVLAARFESTTTDAVLWRVAAPVRVVNDSGLAEQVRASLRRRGTPLFADPVIDSADYDYDDPALVPWFDRPDAEAHIARLRADETIGDHEATALRQFVTDGYLVLEDLIDEALVDAVNAEVDDAIANNHEGYVYGTSQRIEKLHHLYPNVRKLWLDGRYLRILDLVFGETARPCQTLNFVFGSQQTPHQDSAFLTPFPAGYMCGTWIALQDIDVDSGELVIYPGSHRAPRPRMADLDYSKADKEAHRNTMSVDGAARLERFWEAHTAAYGARKVTYRPRRGTVLIWHENLLHGGGRRIDESLTRRSMVIHAFADGAITFYDHSGYIGYAAPKEFRSSPDGLRLPETVPSY